MHTKAEISEIHKFTYLKSLLEKSAKEAVAGMALSSANYNQAIEILKRKFGNKEKIINCHMEALVAMESVQSDGNVGVLRKIYDKNENHIRSLEALVVKADTYESLLCPKLLKKLPPELKLNVSRKLSSEKWEVDKIMEVALGEIEARERTESVGHGEKKRGREPKELHTGVTLLSTNNAESYCFYCKQSGHSAQMCRKSMKPEERRRILQQSGRCYVCLKTGHMASRCRSGMSCTKCKGQHHTTICNGGSHNQIRDRRRV